MVIVEQRGPFRSTVYQFLCVLNQTGVNFPRALAREITFESSGRSPIRYENFGRKKCETETSGRRMSAADKNLEELRFQRGRTTNDHSLIIVYFRPYTRSVFAAIASVICGLSATAAIYRLNNVMDEGHDNNPRPIIYETAPRRRRQTSARVRGRIGNGRRRHDARIGCDDAHDYVRRRVASLFVFSCC